MYGIHHFSVNVEKYLVTPKRHSGTAGAIGGVTAISTTRMPPKNPAIRRPLRLGFVALSDCAPIAMAAELGLFAQYGIAVELRREVGWATVRDKIIYGELDAAHAPAGLVVAASCGLGSVRTECLTGLVLNLHGNAITLSQRLWQEGVRDGATLRQRIAQGGEPPVFGVVHAYSAHRFLLRNWLRAHRLEPERAVRIVVVPPAQVHGNLYGTSRKWINH